MHVYCQTRSVLYVHSFLRDQTSPLCHRGARPPRPMPIYIYIYICLYIYTYIHVCCCVYTHKCVYMHIDIGRLDPCFIYTHFSGTKRLRSAVPALDPLAQPLYIYIYMCIYIYIYTHTYIHIYVCAVT